MNGQSVKPAKQSNGKDQTAKPTGFYFANVPMQISEMDIRKALFQNSFVKIGKIVFTQDFILDVNHVFVQCSVVNHPQPTQLEPVTCIYGENKRTMVLHPVWF